MSYPITIGAKGGSGTRIFAEVLEGLGVYMGDNINLSKDAMYYVPFIHKYYLKYLEAWLNEKHTSMHSKMKVDLASVVKQHREKVTQKWGWKNPQGMHLLPFYHEVYPDMKFIHVVRDGKDMVFSKNLNEYIQVESLGFYKEFKGSNYEKYMLYWQKSNLMVHDYGVKNMKNNYICLRFEDLCFQPIESIKKIAYFLNEKWNPKLGLEMSKKIKEPSSIGRWKKADQKIVKRIEKLGKKALETFNY